MPCFNNSPHLPTKLGRCCCTQDLLNTPHSRFDILVADPKITLTTHGDKTVIVSDQGQETSLADPFSLLQQQLDKFAPAMPAHPDLPFQGGALGLFGYDLGRRVEKIA